MNSTGTLIFCQCDIRLNASTVPVLHIAGPVPRFYLFSGVNIIRPYKLHWRRATAARFNVGVPMELREPTCIQAAATMQPINVLGANVVKRPRLRQRYQSVVRVRWQCCRYGHALSGAFTICCHTRSCRYTSASVNHQRTRLAAICHKVGNSLDRICVHRRISRLNMEPVPSIGRSYEVGIPFGHVDHVVRIAVELCICMLREHLAIKLVGDITQAHLGHPHFQPLS
mmetsp:Transcript_28175/g.65118  ORF Transcript_28175/g.65118 Transcript_28175/m.65118 type:complete len:227 (-) Transcript_28175:248-928(-)